MGNGRQIWFKRILWRYYPVHIYGWISLILTILFMGLMYVLLHLLNEKINLVDDVVVVFVSVGIGLAILSSLARKHP